MCIITLATLDMQCWLRIEMVQHSNQVVSDLFIE